MPRSNAQQARQHGPFPSPLESVPSLMCCCWLIFGNREFGTFQPCWSKMRLSSVSPIAVLRPYVRCFEQREAMLELGEVVYPIAARPDQFIEFYLAERFLIRLHDLSARELAPRSVVVGPCTYCRVDLVLHGRFEVFTI